MFHTRCVRLAVTKGHDTGRLVNLLERRSASRLYSDLHRGPVAVLFEAPSWVRTSPGDDVERKRMVSIGQFCKYKAFSMSLEDNRAGEWESMFDDWLNTVSCDGPRDPRILPFHIFEAQQRRRRALRLDDASERKRFRELHMRDGELEDASKRRWRAAEPNARHGRDPQFVRNLELPLGFHWDVRKFNGTRIETPMSVWKVDRGGHINAYADGHIRPGTSCRSIWADKQSKSADEADRRKSSA